MLRLYNSYTRCREIFKPQSGKTVKMYNCGPTVYDFAHIGNLRSFLLADILRRYLEYRGYSVKQVMNITDVGHMVGEGEIGEDKMSVAMRREGKGPEEVARFYEGKFFEDIDALGVRRAWKYPRATEHVKEMITLVKKLLKRGHAYKVLEHNTPHPSPAPHPTPLPRGEGDWAGRGGESDFPSPLGRGQGEGHSIYYDLSTFPKYGKLSGNTVADLIPGARAELIQEKRNPYDFALWIYKPRHVLQWSSPWGAGYPGWHLECSAMAMKYLGPTLDIHTGGEDNKFPHHECEIAQSEGATGKPFSRYWMHAKHLLVDGKKMSKSLHNFYTLRDLLAKGFSAPAVHYILIATHYREPLNFTLPSVRAAESALERVGELVEKLRAPSPGLRPPSPIGRGVGGEGISKAVAKARRDFISAMDDDLNVSKALGVLFDFIREINQKISNLQFPIPKAQCQQVLELLQEFDTVLGLGIGETKKSVIPAEVLKLAGEREVARKAKNWARADELRAEIKNHGYAVEDTSNGGPRLKKIRM